MTKAYLAGLFDYLAKNGNKNPFDSYSSSDCYQEYEHGYNEGYDIRIGDVVVGSEAA